MRLSRGAVLLYTLVLLAVIMLISLAVLAAALTLFGSTERSAQTQKSIWIAEAGLADISRRLSLNAVSPWNFREEKKPFGDGEYTIRIRVLSERFLISSSGAYKGAISERTNSIRVHFFSDYTLAVRGGYTVADGQSNASFPLLTDGDVIIRPQPQQYYASFDRSPRPIITLGGELRVLSATNNMIHVLSYAKRGPFVTYTERLRSYAGEVAASGAVHRLSLRFPSIDAVHARGSEHAFDASVITAYTNICNPYLMTKEYLTSSGDGSIYLLDRALPSYAHIYIITRRDERSPAALDPYRYDDALNTEPSCQIDGRHLICNDASKRYRIRINDAGVNRINEFPLSSSGYNNISMDRPLATVSFDNYELNPAIDYSVRDHALVLRKSMSFRYFAAYADGRKTRYRITRTNAALVFADGIRVRDVHCQSGELVFSSPPAYGARIECYERMPLIEITKAKIPSACDLYTDSFARVRVVSLEDIPADTIIADVPLFIRGETKRRMKVISKSDVYLGDIRAERFALSVYGRSIFTLAAGYANVFLFTEGQNIYPLSGGVLAITGSITISRRYPVFSFTERDMSRKIFDDGRALPQLTSSSILSEQKEDLFFIE